jgi:NAD+ kinase
VAVVGLVVHHERPQAAELATAAHGWLEREGHSVRVLRVDVDVVGVPGDEVEEMAFAGGLDVAVSLGGDGTMLRTVDLVAGAGVPVIGVNLGQLGYLTEVEPADLLGALERYLAGAYTIEERMMLAVTTVCRGGTPGPSSSVALNEVVLEKTPMGHTVRLDVAINDKFFTTYAADGLIVSTPTGSTAYSFSARGPIVAPTHRGILLTPVSPHMLFDRSLVLDPATSVRLEVAGHRPATVSVDGRNLGMLTEGDAIVCTAAARSARLVTFGPRDFHRILKAKFGLNDR